MWVLDDGPFGLLAAEVPASELAAWPVGLLAVVSTTAAAADNDQSGRRPALLKQTKTHQRNADRSIRRDRTDR